jgi:Phosphotransferase enzyme family
MERNATADLVDAFCRRRLGAGVKTYEFHAESVASVHGVTLDDGRRVVVKVYRDDADTEHLAAVQAVQTGLAAAGFPAPEPVLGPETLAVGVAIVESLLDAGERADAHDPPIRRAVAAGLARFVEEARPLAGVPGLRRLRKGMDLLWATPHDPRFDFPGTAHGAEWIDRLAEEAARELDRTGAGDTVLGHADWRVEHLRFTGGALSAVYDWDSLALGREPELAAAAAHAFTVDWSLDEFPGFPSPEESLAFIADYEEARGAPFTPAERRTADLALVRSLAYGARCEHSDALTDFGTRPPDAGPAPPDPGGYRDLLARHAERGRLTPPDPGINHA